jgi:hypothetical protein
MNGVLKDPKPMTLLTEDATMHEVCFFKEFV